MATLAVGIAASVVMYGVVDVLVWAAPPHVAAPDALRIVGRLSSLSEFTQLKNQSRTLDVAAFRSRRAQIDVGASPTEVSIECVTDSYFELLGTRAVLGVASVGGDQSGLTADLSIVLSDRLWRERFGADFNLIGRKLSINGRPGRIGGIAPPRFQGLLPAPPEAWISLSAAPEICALHGSLDTVSVTIVGRIRPDATESAAIAELNQLMPGSAGMRDPWLKSLQDARLAYIRADVRAAQWTAVAAILLMIIACINVSGLLLLEADRRRQEIALRVHLGATVGRLIRMLLAEQAAVAVASAAAALILTVLMISLLRGLTPFAPDRLVLDGKSAGLVVLLGAAASTVSAILPVLHLLGAAFGGRNHGASVTTRWRRSDLALGAQWALAFALIASAWQMAQSVRNLVRTVGYDPQHVVVANIDTRGFGFVSEQELESIYQRLADRSTQLTDVEAAGLGSVDLLTQTLDYSVAAIQSSTGPVPPETRALPPAILQAVSPDYFRALGMRVSSGGLFKGPSIGTEPIAIIDRTLANAIWPNVSPVGRCAYPVGTSECVRIVGVSEPRRAMLLEYRAPEIFVPLGQVFGRTYPRAPRAMFIRVRGSVQPAMPELSKALRDAARPFPLAVEPLLSRVADLSKTRRLAEAMFAWCGSAATFIAAIGLYAALAFRVQTRRPEIGLRLALGASIFRAIWPTFSTAMKALAAGAVFGCLLMAVAGRLMGALLFEASPIELSNVGAASAVLFFASLLGLGVPAIRATRVDPVVSLRRDE